MRVLLSIDGGNSFPFVLRPSTPNTGSATVTVPNLPGTTARVKVEAIDNVFFNISHVFSITANSTAPPVLLTEANSNRAIALDSVTFLRAPFPLTTINNFSLDLRTRVALFAVGLELMPGEDASAVTAQAKDANDKTYLLPVEFVGRVPGFPWLTQLVVRLPSEFIGTGDLLISVQVHGTTSNTVVIGIR